MGVAPMTPYEAIISAASRDVLDSINASWWSRSSGIPLETIQGWIAARIKDLDDQDIIRDRPEVVPE